MLPVTELLTTTITTLTKRQLQEEAKVLLVARRALSQWNRINNDHQETRFSDKDNNLPAGRRFMLRNFRNGRQMQSSGAGSH
ncbi:hypothetical protein EMCRGX_G025600 [Ephydatia muelleri]